MYHHNRRHVKNSTAFEQVPLSPAAIVETIKLRALASADIDQDQFRRAATDQRVTCHDMRVLSNVHLRVPYFQGLCPAAAHYSLCVLQGLGYVSAQQLAECVQ